MLDGKQDTQDVLVGTETHTKEGTKSWAHEIAEDPSELPYFGNFTVVGINVSYESLYQVLVILPSDDVS